VWNGNSKVLRHSQKKIICLMGGAIRSLRRAGGVEGGKFEKRKRGCARKSSQMQGDSLGGGPIQFLAEMGDKVGVERFDFAGPGSGDSCVGGCEKTRVNNKDRIPESGRDFEKRRLLNEKVKKTRKVEHAGKNGKNSTIKVGPDVEGETCQVIRPGTGREEKKAMGRGRRSSGGKVGKKKPS